MSRLVRRIALSGVFALLAATTVAIAQSPVPPSIALLLASIKKADAG